MVSKKLEGSSLKLATQYRDLTNELLERRNVIQSDASKKWAAVKDEIGAELDEIWKRICALEGIDDNGCWRLDERYIDEHDVAFIVLDEERQRLLLAAREDEA